MPCFTKRTIFPFSVRQSNCRLWNLDMIPLETKRAPIFHWVGCLDSFKKISRKIRRRSSEHFATSNHATPWTQLSTFPGKTHAQTHKSWGTFELRNFSDGCYKRSEKSLRAAPSILAPKNCKVTVSITIGVNDIGFLACNMDSPSVPLRNNLKRLNEQRGASSFPRAVLFLCTLCRETWN